MNPVVLSFLTIIGAGISAYFGAYLKKKGENLATHEDINKVLVEVRATTQATKEIEAKISDEVWDRQKRWELKREVLFEAMRRVADIEEVLNTLNAIFRMNAQRTVSVEASRSEPRCTPNRLYLHETSAHTPASKLSEPLGLVAGLARQVFT